MGASICTAGAEGGSVKMAEMTKLKGEAQELDAQLWQLTQTKAELERTIAAQESEVQDLHQRHMKKETREKVETVDGLREELAATTRQLDLARGRHQVIQQEIEIREKKKERQGGVVIRCSFCGTILPWAAHTWPTKSGCYDYCQQQGAHPVYKSIKAN